MKHVVTSLDVIGHCRRLYRRFPDNHFPGQTFPGQVILRNFPVHNVCKYQLCRPSHTICRYPERLLICACRPAVSIRGLFGKACSPTMGKAVNFVTIK